MMRKICCGIVLMWLTSGCGAPQSSQAGAAASGASSGASGSAGFTPAVNMMDLMDSVIDPNADVIWGSVGTIITADRVEELVPKNDEEWKAVRNAAVTVAESGNLLLVADRGPGVEDEDWKKMSVALIEVGSRAMKAAEDKNRDELFDTGGEIYSVCVACHQKYIDEIANPVQLAR